MTIPALATAAVDAATGPVIITKPGVYDMAANIYHSDPVPGGSLSSTGARQLTPPSCPALYHHKRNHPRTPTDEMNLGSAAHKVVLGKGEEIVVLHDDDGEPYTDYKKPAARALKAEILEQGKIPLLEKQYLIVQEMAAAIRNHPGAMKLLAAGVDASEKALFWKKGSVWKRALIDHLPPKIPGRRMIVVDYKTCAKADPESIAKSMLNFAYHQQADHYSEGIRALDIDQNPVFVFIFQEKEAPYLVTLAQPDANAMRIAAHLNKLATLTYAECTASGHWPSYSEDIEVISLPPWEEKKYEGEVW